MHSVKGSQPAIIRSLLFVPGDSERKLQRAVDSESDALILDLEDSVSEPAGPYLLCGHSFGGLVAFEMARQLLLLHERAASVILLDTGVDERYWPKMAWRPASRERSDQPIVDLTREDLNSHFLRSFLASCRGLASRSDF
jgi:thioesterase domain-containing protein